MKTVYDLIAQSGPEVLTGFSSAIARVNHLTRQYKKSRLIFISGEAGVGKKTVAMHMHSISPWHQKPFVSFRCPELPKEEKEELFYKDIIEDIFVRKTNGGIKSYEIRPEFKNSYIYIANIERASDEMQRAILRFLQNPEDVCMILSATEDLEDVCARNLFSVSLRNAIAKLPCIFLPALRERLEDVVPLSEYLMRKRSEEYGKFVISSLPHEVRVAFYYNNWTGNLAELDDHVRKIVRAKENAEPLNVGDLTARLRSILTSDLEAFYQGQGRAWIDKTNFQAKNMKRTASAIRAQLPPFSPAEEPPPPPQVQASKASPVAPPPSQSNKKIRGVLINPKQDFTAEVRVLVRREMNARSDLDFYKLAAQFEDGVLTEALSRTKHNRNRAAKLLNMNRTTLVERLKKLSKLKEKIESLERDLGAGSSSLQEPSNLVKMGRDSSSV